LCFHDFVDDLGEEMPELATNGEWRTIMARARRDQGLSQAQLGDTVGLSQVMISKIESGESSSSTFILRICRRLQIPTPSHYADEESRHWSELGHVLRHGDPEQYEAMMRMIETVTRRIQEAQTEAHEAAAQEPPRDRTK
jgi:transcriptional regulator with XRE-family HTH domain